MPVLPAPPRHRDGIVEWVRAHLGHLACDDVAASPIRGGQQAADAALAGLDISGYAARRSVVRPLGRRGASGLSPYIRHGLLSLPTVWDAVAGAPSRDRRKFRDELLWQEYARHLYARIGRRLAEPLRFAPPATDHGWRGRAWPPEMACMQATTAELYDDGWLVNQARMWLASQYTVRAGGDWRTGEREFYRHLLDGSPAANRLGWQWTVGTATGKVYGFSRWQVEKRAPELCGRCPLRTRCPIQGWPDTEQPPKVDPPPGLGGGHTDAGPEKPTVSAPPEVVWLTAESLGDTDPALAAQPHLPRVFVFDEPLLRQLRLSGKRLVFLAEAVAELGAEVRLGDVPAELSGQRLATTWTFTPGWKRRTADMDVVALYPWPWLRRPGTGSLRSYSAWVRSS